MIEVLKDIGIAVGVPVARSVGGWLTNALKDGYIDNFEMRQLGATVLKTGIIGAMIYFGADSVGIEVDVVGSAIAAVLLDLIASNKKK